MKLAICGGTGFIGSHLSEYWIKQGHEITIITRKARANQPDGMKLVTWDELSSNPHLLESLDAVVNLSGESLNQRWTKDTKSKIKQSRLDSVHRLGDILDQLTNKPQAVIQSSAVGIYGTSRKNTFNEYSEVESIDFLSDVCVQWEDAARQRFNNTRLVLVRTGVVLGSKGAYPLMQLPYKFGVGGPIGDGEQWVSWIHINDMVKLIDYAVRNPDMSGPVNATSPYPVTNRDFGKTIGKVLHRPHWFPAPSFMLKALLGEMSILVLEGQKAVPDKAQECGFQFDYPRLDEAIRQLTNN
ncbi:epimerase family protein YfhF [Paenibacillus sp. J45TS6]|uniref:TIGR01777 family oxidoreductase n=1 Tax=Paenibacillus sp. J45TS6 TaxID=2807196 RepID=UPI001B19224C|nr:TIGR01777 family oxidoreductase [Paenibacillus sp. J45TS6]GIP44529.1 epimerase family protein YfhF [Paenibacillus sp. J45TS6]